MKEENFKKETWVITVDQLFDWSEYLDYGEYDKVVHEISDILEQCR